MSLVLLWGAVPSCDPPALCTVWGHGGQCGDWGREQAALGVSVRAQICLIG